MSILLLLNSVACNCKNNPYLGETDPSGPAIHENKNQPTDSEVTGNSKATGNEEAAGNSGAAGKDETTNNQKTEKSGATDNAEPTGKNKIIGNEEVEENNGTTGSGGVIGNSETTASNQPADNSGTTDNSEATGSNKATGSGKTAGSDKTVKLSSTDITDDMVASLKGMYHSPDTSPILKNYLVNKKGDVNQQDGAGCTLLNLLAVDISIFSEKDKNPEKYAAQLELLNALLNRGARPDIADYKGITPLLRWVGYCVAKEDRDTEMEILKKMLSFPNLQNTHSKSIHFRKSAYEVAQWKQDKEVLDLLITAGITS